MSLGRPARGCHKLATTLIAKMLVAVDMGVQLPSDFLYPLRHPYNFLKDSFV